MGVVVAGLVVMGANVVETGRVTVKGVDRSVGVVKTDADAEDVALLDAVLGAGVEPRPARMEVKTVSHASPVPQQHSCCVPALVTAEQDDVARLL